MRDRTIYISEYQARKRHYELQEGEAIQLTVDWSAVSDAAGADVESVAWSNERSVVSVSGESLSDNKASALISANTCGSVVLVNTATLADGQVRKARIEIIVSRTGVNR